jgi:hypothetical protein
MPFKKRFHFIKNLLQVTDSHQARERNRGHPSWKGRNQVVIVCRQHDLIYRKMPRIIRTNKFSKVAGHKINIQNQQHFYTPKAKLSKKEIKKLQFHLQ